ncbi:MAG TPA: MFS transporter [Alphaproteobacteria bacterium]
MKDVVHALVATLAAQLLVSMSVGTGSVLAPEAAVDIGVRPELIGAYIGSIYATAAAVGLVSGAFIARFGALRMTQASLVLSALALSLGVLAMPLTTFLCALLLGAANGPTTPSSSTVLARVTPARWRNAVFSAKQMGVPLGNGLAGLLMPFLALAWGWRIAALTGAVLCLVLALALQPLRRKLDIDRERGRRLVSFAHVSGALTLVLGSPGLRRLSIMSFVYSGLQNCFVGFLVTYLHARVAMSLVQAGLVLAVSLVAGAIGRLVWGALTDHLANPYRLLGALGLGMSACALLTAAFTPEWPYGAILAVSIAFGATTTAWNGVFLAQIAALSPPGRVGDATGGSQFCTFAGVTLMPVVFSLILTLTTSYTIGYSAMGVLTAVVGVWLLRVPTLQPVLRTNP